MASSPVIDETGRFIDDYLQEHGLQGELKSDALTTVLDRADMAREQFKKSRPKDETVVDHSSLTQSQKYRRRLENNKKSAAATRVFNEVLRKESARALRDLELSVRRTRAELLDVKARLTYAEEQLARMNENSNEGMSSKVGEPFTVLSSPTSAHPYFDHFPGLQPIQTTAFGVQSAPSISQPRAPTTSASLIFSFRPPPEVQQSLSFRLPPVPEIQKATSTRRSASSSPMKGAGCVRIAPAPSHVAEPAADTVFASLTQRETIEDAEREDNKENRDCADKAISR